MRKSAALDYAAQNIRVNAVCPDIIATPMMERFTGGTHEGEQRVIAQNQLGGWVSPRKSPRPLSGYVRMRPPSSLGTPWSSTAGQAA